jgi:4-amino-4-deoxy-L-arabinose transferase-like glycosyltransferase
MTGEAAKVGLHSSRGLLVLYGAGFAIAAAGLSGVLLRQSRRSVARWLAILGLALAGLALARGSGWLGDEVLRAPPFLGEALLRAERGGLGAVAVLLAAQVLGRGLTRVLRWRPAEWTESLLFHTSLGLCALSNLCLALALSGAYTPTGIRILLGVILLAGLGCAGPLVARRLAAASRRPAADALIPDRALPPAVAVWIAISAVAVLMALVGALAPETEFDALSYHLWYPSTFLEQGRLVAPVWEYTSLYPMEWELLFGAAMAIGGPVAAKLLHFACLPLAGLLVYLLTRRFAGERAAGTAWLAVALLVTAPTVLWEATTAYVDLALALPVGLAVYALLRYVDDGHGPWLALATINMGLALATKHLALVVLLFAAAGLSLHRWLTTRELRSTLVPVVQLSLGSLLIASPWYLRGWLASGNPVFPELYGLFGASPPERWSAVTEAGLNHYKEHFGRPRTLSNLLTLPWDMTVHASRYGGSLGPLFLLLLPGLAFSRRGPDPVRWVVGLVAGYLGVWASPLGSFQLRLLVPIAPLLAVLGAQAAMYVAVELRRCLGRWAAETLHAALCVLLLLNLPPWIPLHEVDRGGSQGWLTHVVRQVPTAVVLGQESEQAYLTRSVPSFAAWQFINASLPAEARVLTFSDGDHLYSRRARVWSDATVARPAVWGATPADAPQARRTLYELGVTHLLVDKRQVEQGVVSSLAITDPGFIAAWLEPMYADGRFVLYRLHPEVGGAQSPGQ